MGDVYGMTRRHVDAAVAAMVKQTYISEPAVLTGVWAADYLGRVACDETSRRVRLAREDGYTWAEIGSVLTLRPEDRSPGEAAFEYVVGPPEPGSWERSFSWRCPACDRFIRDVGPYDVNPADCELGHAHDCGRLAADVAAWQASLEDEGGS